jgi:hypothetical protein
LSPPSPVTRPMVISRKARNQEPEAKSSRNSGQLPVFLAS